MFYEEPCGDITSLNTNYLSGFVYFFWFDYRTDLSHSISIRIIIHSTLRDLHLIYPQFSSSRHRRYPEYYQKKSIDVPKRSDTNLIPIWYEFSVSSIWNILLWRFNKNKKYERHPLVNIKAKRLCLNVSFNMKPIICGLFLFFIMILHQNNNTRLLIVLSFILFRLLFFIMIFINNNHKWIKSFHVTYQH